MAHPLFIMEQALRQFSSQWYAGFRPSLEIQTKYDGSLVVHSKSFCSNKPPFDRWEKSDSQSPFSSTPKSKRAKKNARYRRNKEHKMEASTSGRTTDVETQYSVEDGAPNTETKNGDSGFKENSDENFTLKEATDISDISYIRLDNDLVGRGFSDIKNDESALSKATNVPSNSPVASKSNIETIEVLHETSAAAIHKCEGCLKELNRTLEHHPDNLACEDCCKEQERLDPNEENRNEENPPRCSSCTEESLCQGCEEPMEKLFSNLIGLINLGQEKKVPKKKKKGKKKICPLCTNSDVFNFEWELDMEELMSLLTDRRIVQVQDSPCKDCMRLLYMQHWFSLEESYLFISNIYERCLDKFQN